MECEYCKKVLGSKYSLIQHQKKTKSCIDIQNKMNTERTEKTTEVKDTKDTKESNNVDKHVEQNKDIEKKDIEKKDDNKLIEQNKNDEKKGKSQEDDEEECFHTLESLAAQNMHIRDVNFSLAKHLLLIDRELTKVKKELQISRENEAILSIKYGKLVDVHLFGPRENEDAPPRTTTTHRWHIISLLDGIPMLEDSDLGDVDHEDDNEIVRTFNEKFPNLKPNRNYKVHSAITKPR